MDAELKELLDDCTIGEQMDLDGIDYIVMPDGSLKDRSTLTEDDWLLFPDEDSELGED